MGPIKEALTFDDVTLAPKYSSVLPSDVQTETSLASNLQLKIPLITSAMDTVTEAKMAIAIAKSRRNWGYTQEFIRKETSYRNKKGKIFGIKSWGSSWSWN